MRLTISTALHNALNFVGTTIQKVACLTKPQVKFLLYRLECRWTLLLRCNFLNLSRAFMAATVEKLIRNQFANKLSFVSLFDALFSPLKKMGLCIQMYEITLVCAMGTIGSLLRRDDNTDSANQGRHPDEGGN